MSRTIDKITLQERADWTVYESTGITFDNMAFGQPVDMISPTATEFLAFNSSIFEEQVWFVGDALGAALDEVTATVEAVAAQQDHQIFDHGWTLTIEGDPSMRAHFYSLASFTRAASVEEHVRSASVATAMQVLNGVPAICETSTGFVTTASLSLIYNQRAFRQP
ncbi:MAG TPA: hypothetical protein VEX40_18400 [Mycobacterium sp.]|nr:hypothetical protein [Mycobacterium sp.]